MSDEQERKLWRVAVEQAPDVVRWVETRLRRGLETPIVQNIIHIPDFTHTFSASRTLAPFEISHLTVHMPVQQGHPSFHMVGMSIFIDRNSEQLRNVGTSLVRIRDMPGNITEHPLSMLLVPHLDPPFKPGLLVERHLTSASMLSAEISSYFSETTTFCFAIHGSYEGPWHAGRT